jgi:betaine-aldehyde dehydrogenase
MLVESADVDAISYTGSTSVGRQIAAAGAKTLKRVSPELGGIRGGPVTDDPLAGGSFYRPSLVEVEPLSGFLIQNEVFGPVQTFEIFDDEADAIERANATEFGLGTAIFTKDEMRARRVGRAIRAGLIWTNCWAVLSEHFEQSGFKQSGPGTLCGPTAIEEFQKLKIYATARPTP